MRRRVLLPTGLAVGTLALGWNARAALRLSSALPEHGRREEAVLSTVPRPAERRDAHRPRPRRVDEGGGRGPFPRTTHLLGARAPSRVSANHEEEPRRRPRSIDVDRRTLRVWEEIEDDDNYPMPPTPPAKCVPLSSWQERSYPNCNALHELDLRAAARRGGLRRVGSGGFNRVFQVHGRRASSSEGGAGDREDVALKLLARLSRSDVPPSTLYLRANYDLVRRDALVAERLTSSAHIVDIYGYCGFATVVPFAAEGRTLADALDNVAENADGGNASWRDLSPQTQLARIADAAAGLAAVHDLPAVHGDVGAKQVSLICHYSCVFMPHASMAALSVDTVQYLFVDGRLQLGDFNSCVLPRRNTVAPGNEEACTVPLPLDDAPPLPPEQQYRSDPRLTRAVDVWMFGSMLRRLLVPPVDVLQRRRQETNKYEVPAAVAAGRLPNDSDDVRQRADPVDRLLWKALEMCRVYDPDQRATARELALFLQQGMEERRARRDLLAPSTKITNSGRGQETGREGGTGREQMATIP